MIFIFPGTPLTFHSFRSATLQRTTSISSLTRYLIQNSLLISRMYLNPRGLASFRSAQCLMASSLAASATPLPPFTSVPRLSVSLRGFSPRSLGRFVCQLSFSASVSPDAARAGCAKDGKVLGLSLLSHARPRGPPALQLPRRRVPVARSQQASRKLRQ